MEPQIVSLYSCLHHEDYRAPCNDFLADLSSSFAPTILLYIDCQFDY